MQTHSQKSEDGERGQDLDAHGGVAQLGEHLPCKQGVDSSILFISTRGKRVWTACHVNGLIAQVVRARA